MSQSPADGTFQFGAGTVVPPDVELLILDCFETLVELRGRSYFPRQGISDLLDHFAGRLGAAFGH